MSRRWIAAAAAVLVLLVAAWWFASPWWTLREMRAAAEARDSRRLSEHVDYPALREDLKADVGRHIAEQAGQQPDGSLAALGSILAGAIAGPLIDSMVTPQGVEAMFRNNPRPPAKSSKAASNTAGRRASGLPQAPQNEAVLERHGLNRFTFRHKDERKGSLMFERSGLRWKLTGVELPETAGAVPE